MGRDRDPGAGRAPLVDRLGRRLPRSPVNRLLTTFGALRFVGARPAHGGTSLWFHWWRWTTLGETVGFCFPAVVAVALPGVSPPALAGALLVAGAVEGAVLGAAQAHVLRRALPSVEGVRWIAATAVAALFAWALALTPTVVPGGVGGWPAAVLVPAAVVAGLALLLSVGVAQWWVLRPHVPRAWLWIPANAVAWSAGLAMFALVSTPLWREGQGPVLVALIGVGAGLVMAATFAAVTGWALVRLLRRARQGAPEPERAPRGVTPGG
ncbi:hypothetical protein H3146_10925 [Streptomyces sp. OF3]|uniref:Uncharacterized protein n=1 Tax=Streptomyces alkaliterrae TaxID=2213162 RepID=A0A7W3ZMY6_9ACTN|nr:hypothetical protein [Streptomyces alkaliterrae]MBB1253872.1 hypothetical protein [Streptomyces alkaliterrae]